MRLRYLFPWIYHTDNLFEPWSELWRKYNLSNRFHINPQTLINFADAIEESYQIVSKNKISCLMVFNPLTLAQVKFAWFHCVQKCTFLAFYSKFENVHFCTRWSQWVKFVLIADRAINCVSYWAFVSYKDYRRNIFRFSLFYLIKNHRFDKFSWKIAQND